MHNTISLISFAEEVELIARSIRSHWRIENSLHRHLDVTFREGQHHARKDNSAQNLNIQHKYALAIATQKKRKLSVKKCLFKAALNT